MSTPSRQCLGCGQLGGWGRGGRCPRCRVARRRRLERDPRRRALKSARYDASHRRLRRSWLPYVQLGVVRCARARYGECLLDDSLILPHQPWDLDHLANGTSAPSHAPCNRAAINRQRKETHDHES